VTDLDGLALGLANEDDKVLLVDGDAAGWGWFVDPSLSGDSEFARRLNGDTDQASPGSPAYGRIDLLTVVEHELGHLLGYEHGTLDVMAESLAAGVRISPPAGSAAGPSATSAGPGDGSLVLPPASILPAAVQQPIAIGPATPGATGPLASSFWLSSGSPQPLAGLAGGTMVTVDARSSVDLGSQMSPWQIAPAFAGLGFADLPAASASSSSVRATEPSNLVDSAIINWDRDGLSSLDTQRSSEGSKDWLDDFLNHRGQTGQQRNPNVGLRVMPAGSSQVAG
jgi:hypothetical protein